MINIYYTVIIYKKKTFALSLKYKQNRFVNAICGAYLIFKNIIFLTK